MMTRRRRRRWGLDIGGRESSASRDTLVKYLTSLPGFEHNISTEEKALRLHDLYPEVKYFQKIARKIHEKRILRPSELVNIEKKYRKMIMRKND